jgi:hypothetical protein
VRTPLETFEINVFLLEKPASQNGSKTRAIWAISLKNFRILLDKYKIHLRK